ncbi:hypothetical protein D3C87_2088420 [compost metagenome]
MENRPATPRSVAVPGSHGSDSDVPIAPPVGLTMASPGHANLLTPADRAWAIGPSCDSVKITMIAI